MSKATRLYQATMKSPILWGALATAGFYGLIHGRVLNHWLIVGYCARHPVEYITVAMFFIGLAALTIKVMDTLAQSASLKRPLLGALCGGGQPVADCDALLSQLGEVSAGQRGGYLVPRLKAALEHVRRRGSAEMLDDELKYLADVDAGRLHASYGLVRVIIWAIPMLGFLGTVIGLTKAIANLEPSALERSSMGVVAGLATAFDTTALALALSLVLMFIQFITDKRENALLDEVDRRATEELSGRFIQVADTPEGQLVAVRRMAETVIEASGRLVEQQADVWAGSMEAAAARWTRMSETSGAQLQTTLAKALEGSLKSHAHELAVAQGTAARQSLQHWEQVQQSQTRQLEAMGALQAALREQAEVLGRAVEATGKVARLEETLNRNLATLAGAKNFEQTVMSLAAAIHLLNARLTDEPDPASKVKLQGDSRSQHAA